MGKGLYVWYLVKILSKEWISGTSNASDVVVSIRCHLSWYDLRFWRCATTPSLIWLATLSKHSSLTPRYSSLTANALFFLKDTKFYSVTVSRIRINDYEQGRSSIIIVLVRKILNFSYLLGSVGTTILSRTIVLMLLLCIVTDLQVEMKDLTESCEVPRTRYIVAVHFVLWLRHLTVSVKKNLGLVVGIIFNQQ